MSMSRITRSKTRSLVAQHSRLASSSDPVPISRPSSAEIRQLFDGPRPPLTASQHLQICWPPCKPSPRSLHGPARSGPLPSSLLKPLVCVSKLETPTPTMDLILPSSTPSFPSANWCSELALVISTTPQSKSLMPCPGSRERLNDVTSETRDFYRAGLLICRPPRGLLENVCHSPLGFLENAFRST